MWKILRLYLKNFAQIMSGLDKKEITLDFSINDKVINIFIGKIGSGKTAILGHLQPFATYGTLDIRNQDDPIIPGETGKKEISFLHNDIIFDIQHVYSWNKHTESHNIKSYIQMNGEELNPNGNTGSFKELIKIHFGLDQNYLRVLRLGPNVANIIEMRAAERKSFIASLRPDTDIYLMLYKHLSEDLRKVNSALAVLSKKLVSLSSGQEEKLKSEFAMTVEDHREVSAEYETEKTAYFMDKGTLSSILQNRSVDDLKTEYTHSLETFQSLSNQLEDLKKSQERINTSMSLTDVMREIGKVEMTLQQISAQATLLEEEMKNTNLELAKWKERKAILGEKDQMADLAQTIANLEAKYEDYKRRVYGFHSNQSYRSLAAFIDSLPITIMTIDSVAGYPTDVISLLYHSDHSILNKARIDIDRLNGRVYNLQRQMTNIAYSAKYRAPYPLVRPPFCPTVECPFIQSHPAIIREKMDEISDDNPLRKLQDEIDRVNGTIARLEEYPVIYQKIQSLKKSWPEIRDIISGFGALKTESLYSILTNSQYRMNWYDHEKLTDALEKCKIQEELYNLEHQVKSAKQELEALETEFGGNIDDKIAEAEVRHIRQRSELQRLSEEKARQSDLLQSLQADARALEHSTEICQVLGDTSRQIEELQKVIRSLQENIQKSNELCESIKRRQEKLTSYEDKLKKLADKGEELRSQLNDIKFTKIEFQAVTEAKDELSMILDATSTKEGIPLILVEVFLEDCREILNELIEDVFSDSLEILPSDANDLELKIPYSINGFRIEDIRMASQGQRAIISIALSFALIRQSVFDYNIMLLDEVDGALYKRDREKFINILFKQLQAIGANQVFLITHNSTFDNSPANIIMTTEEMIDPSPNHTIMRLYESAA